MVVLRPVNCLLLYHHRVQLFRVWGLFKKEVVGVRVNGFGFAARRQPRRQYRGTSLMRKQLPLGPYKVHQSCLTECIHQLILESQLPHKIVNLLFTITHQILSRRFCRGFDLLKLTNKYIVSDKVVSSLAAIASAGCYQTPPPCPERESFLDRKLEASREGSK